jgi:hypothetical protein
MKRSVLAILIILVLIIAGLFAWYWFDNNPAVPLTQNSASSGASALSTTTNSKTIDGITVTIAKPFYIPTVPAGTQPIGVGSEWSSYSVGKYGTRVDYPTGALAVYTSPSDIKNIRSYLPIDPQASDVLTLLPQQYPAGVTVKDVFIVTTASSTPDFKTCIESAWGNGQHVTPGEVSVVPPGAAPASAPIFFYELPGIIEDGCWAGGCPFGSMFVSYQKGVCYSFGQQAAVIEPSNYGGTAAQIKQAEAANKTFEARLQTLFYQILSTVRFQ